MVRRKKRPLRAPLQALTGAEAERLIQLPAEDAGGEERAATLALITTRGIGAVAARRIALLAASPEVRKAMLNFFSNQRVFLHIARKDPDAAVQAEATRRIRREHDLYRILPRADDALAVRIVQRIKNAKVLRKIACLPDDSAVREAATARLKEIASRNASHQEGDGDG